MLTECSLWYSHCLYHRIGLIVEAVGMEFQSQPKSVGIVSEVTDGQILSLRNMACPLCIVLFLFVICDE